MESSITISAITGLIQSLSIAATSLKPPPPDFRPEHFSSYIEPLDLSSDEISTIPEQVMDNWKNHIVHTRNVYGSLITPDSLAGMMINYARKPVSEAENKLRKNALAFYDAQTDEVDRVALGQSWTMVKWIWKRVGDYVAHNLVEGAFLGYNDQQNFERASRFSFLRMMHHATRTDSLRELAFHQKSLYFVRDRIPLIQKHIGEQTEKHKLWRYRWMTAEKVNILTVVLKFQLELYTQIMAKLPDESPHDLKYLVLRNHNRLNSLLAEIKASYFNHMVDIKPTSWLTQKTQNSINWVTDQLSRLHPTPMLQTRPFLEVYMDALQITWDVYDSLFPYTTTERPFDEALSDFVSAVSEDNFIQAKWISLSTSTPNSEFNWKKEAADFENYKRAIDRLIHTQNHLDELITHLQGLNGRLFDEYMKNPTGNLAYSRVNTLIYDIWELRNKIDELRICYRLAYLKKVRTTVNEEDKSYWDRFKQTLINKATRKILEGEFFDKTPTQETVVALFREFIKDYEQKLEEINHIVQELPHSYDDTTPPSALLTPVSRGEEFYPVFYSFDSYRAFFTSTDQLSRSSIDIARYNLKRICTLTGNVFWHNQLAQIEKYFYIDKEFEKLGRLVGIYTKLHHRSDGTLFSQIQKTCAGVRAALHINFHKYIISEWNRLTPIDTKRLGGSLLNKTARLLQSGELSDKTQEFPDLYPTLLKTLDKFATQLNQIIDFDSIPLETLMIANTYVFIPKEQVPVKKSGTRKEKRSRSILLLSVSSGNSTQDPDTPVLNENYIPK